MRLPFLKALLIPVLALAMFGCSQPASQKQGAPYYPGTLTSLFPNYPYPAMTFTATAQTLAQPLSGVSYVTISATAATISTVTFTISLSNDGGTTYYPAACSPYVGSATLASVLTAITTTAVKNLYVCNVAGFTNIQAVTSGTFTATGFQLQIVGTSNKGTL